MPGVLAVMTGTDLPTRHGAIPVARDETALAIEKVRYIGEPIACVAATSEAIARDAANAIRVVYEPIEAIFSIEDALNQNCPRFMTWAGDHPTYFGAYISITAMWKLVSKAQT